MTGFAFSTGEILRATFGRNCFRLALRKLRWGLFLFAAVHLWWLSLIAAPFVAGGSVAAASAVATLALLPFVAMTVRCRSVGIGLYSVTAWNFYAAGLWPGLFRRRGDPTRWIESVVLRDAVPTEDGAAVA